MTSKPTSSLKWTALFVFRIVLVLLFQALAYQRLSIIDPGYQNLSSYTLQPQGLVILLLVMITFYPVNDWLIGLSDFLTAAALFIACLLMPLYPSALRTIHILLAAGGFLMMLKAVGLTGYLQKLPSPLKKPDAFGPASVETDELYKGFVFLCVISFLTFCLHQHISFLSEAFFLYGFPLWSALKAP